MTIFLVIFGFATAFAGVLILINPEWIFGYLRKNIASPSLHVVAVVLRLILGVLMIAYADMSRFPTVILILGWLSIIAALVFALIGRRNFIRLMSWALGLSKSFGRVGGLFATFFGAFLAYAFV